MTSRLVLVLGMHRSGTSLIAASLPCLGVNLGHKLMGPASDNPSGFFEDVEALRLNEALLGDTGLVRWDAVGTRRNGSVSKGLVADAEGLLRARLAYHPIFGLKDPRLCRLVDIWATAARMNGAEVSCVIAVRNPTSIAQSLKRRDRFEYVKSYALWLAYMRDAINGLDPSWPKVVVDYDRMLFDPLGQMKRIGAALDLTLDQGAAEQFAAAFIDKSLDHSDAQGGNLPETVHKAYSVLSLAAQDGIEANELMPFFKQLSASASLAERKVAPKMHFQWPA